MPVAASAQTAGRNWTQFGWDTARTSAPTADMGISAGNVKVLQHRALKAAAWHAVI